MRDFALAFGSRADEAIDDARPVSPHEVSDDTAQEPDEVIDEASQESFPASDPPAWTHTRL